MPKRPPNKGSVKDWHLWSLVGRTVSAMPNRVTKDPKRLWEELEKAVEQTPPPAVKIPDIELPAHFTLGELNIKPEPKPVFVTPKSPTLDRPIEPNLKRRVQRGHVPIDDTIDLHGMTQAQAYESLHRFIRSRALRGDRTLLVITGKGLKKTGYLQIEQKGVLRNMLPLWLNDSLLKPLVAGIEQSHQNHGGEGAFYVRLKRQRE